MENTNQKSIFNLQRFIILQTKLNPATSNLISDAYVYAWYHSVYPYLDDSEIHRTLKDYFDVSEEQVETIANLADAKWLEKKYLTYYEYERLFAYQEKYKEFEIGRVELLSAFRYFFLHGIFDDEFWNGLLKAGEHPIEATSITRPLNISELYLI